MTEQWKRERQRDEELKTESVKKEEEELKTEPMKKNRGRRRPNPREERKKKSQRSKVAAVGPSMRV